MSKPKYRWWSFAMKMIRDYPGLKKRVDALHSETIALRHLHPDDQKVYDAVSRAIEITELQQNGKEHLALIKYVYWGKKKQTLQDAALRCYISETTAKRWHGDFIRLVGECWGFDTSQSTTKHQKS